MFRSAQFVTTPCLLGTHRSLFGPLNNFKKKQFEKPTINNVLCQPFCMISSKRGLQRKYHYISESNNSEYILENPFKHPLSFLVDTYCTADPVRKQSRSDTIFSDYFILGECVHTVPQQTSYKNCLSVTNEERCRRQLQSNATQYDRSKGKTWAAVLVSLCTVKGEPSFLFTLRSSKLIGRHKGDVSFAGGKQDPSDRSIVETALREAREELGIHVTENEVWGVLKPVNYLSGMMIAPVLANLGPLETLSLHPNPDEVEEIFTLTVAHLCNPQNQGYTNFRTGNHYSYTLPLFHNDKYRIWGLTAIALDYTLKLIMPK